MLTVYGQFPTTSELQAILNDFETKDDVWTRDFIGTIVIQTPEIDRKLMEDEMNILRSLGASDIRLFPNGVPGAQLPQGPYFLHYGQLHQAYRLYPDTADAFIVSTILDDLDG